MPLEENEEQTVLAMTSAGNRVEVDRSSADVSGVVVIPEGYTLHHLEDYQLSPDRCKGTATLDDLASFIAYCIRHMNDTTVVYASRSRGSVTAIFNDHLGGQAEWRDWRAHYSAPHSPEWLKWKGSDGKKMTQLEFARFIEDNLPDITMPPGAEMLEIARTFEAKKKVNFSSAIRQQNGSVQLTYEEDLQGSGGPKGSIQIPEEFALGIPVYEEGIHYHVPARLRYRLDGGSLSMWYELIRPHKIIEDAFKAIIDEVAKQTILPVFRGTP